MKKFFILSISIIIVIGLLYGYTLNRDVKEEIDWCIPGNITILDEEMGQEIPTEGNQILEVKGITTYKGRDVCHTEYTGEDGILVQYSTKNKDYLKLIYKDFSGNITNEIEMNQSDFNVNVANGIEMNQSNFEVNITNETELNQSYFEVNETGLNQSYFEVNAEPSQTNYETNITNDANQSYFEVANETELNQTNYE